MEHTLTDGRQVIAALAALGRALGYSARTEHRVGRRAAVDVAWSAVGTTDPLFVFEVESTASSSMANNALKVLGAPNETLTKPLFFFHLVLSANTDNDRVAALRSQWGRHNYRVYMLTGGSGPALVIQDVLEQHRRISDRVEPLAIVSALTSPVWGAVDVPSVLLEAERLGLRGNYLRSYSLLSCADERWLGPWARRVHSLESMTTSQWRESADGYDSYVGRYLPGLIEHALLVRGGQLSDADAPAALDKWQSSRAPGMKTIGPYFGLSRDYDHFVLLVSPLHFAVAYTLCSDAPMTKRWLILEMLGLLNGMAEEGVMAEWRAPTALWCLHIASAGLHQGCDDLGRQEALAAYDAAATCLTDAGGVSMRVVAAPPMPRTDLDDWCFPAGGLDTPSPSETRTLAARAAQSLETRRTPVQLAMAMLTSDDWPRIPAEEMVAAVHFGSETGPGSVPCS